MEQHQIHRNLLGAQCFVVLRIQVAGMVEADVSGLSPGFHQHGAQVDQPLFEKFLQPVASLGGGAQHAEKEMGAGFPVTQHLRKEQTLVDFATVLVHLHPFAFLLYLSSGG